LNNNPTEAYLHSLKVIQAEIARIVFISVPFSEWIRATFVIQTNPDGDARSDEYVYLLQDGTEIHRKYPSDSFISQMRPQVREYIRLSREENQLWFRAIFIVQNTGDWEAGFEYLEHYEPGDIGKKWYTPEHYAVENDFHKLPSQSINLANEFIQKNISQPYEYLQHLASIHEEIAKLVFVSVPYDAWLQAIYVVQATPNGNAFCSQFVYFRGDGTEVRRRSPEATFKNRINVEVGKHLWLTRKANQAWFRLTIIVKNTGKWKIDLKYRDHFEDGDERKWDLPDYGKGEI
jgi:hypothetical protein